MHFKECNRIKILASVQVFCWIILQRCFIVLKLTTNLSFGLFSNRKHQTFFYQTKPIIIVRSSFDIIWYCCHLTNRFRDCKITNFQNVFDNKKYLNVIIIFYIRSFIYYLCIVVPSVKTNNIRFLRSRINWLTLNG